MASFKRLISVSLFFLTVLSSAISYADSAQKATATWTPLMRAIARYNAAVSDAQSAINTATDVTSYVAKAGTLGGTAATLVTKNYWPVVATLGASAVVPSITTTITRACYNSSVQKARNDLYKELQPYLQSPKNPTMHIPDQGAIDLAKEGLALLHSPDMCPPFATRKPEAAYTDILERIILSYSGTDQAIGAVQIPVVSTQLPTKLPIVYHDKYDISFGGIERLHPFDTHKYSKVHTYLSKQFGLSKDQFYTPEIVSQQDMLLVHTPEYLNMLNKSSVLAGIADMPFLAVMPNWLLQKHLMLPMKFATGGTILATQLALEHGWAINISGGYHHAKSNEPVLGGFCFINDIMIAAKKVLNEHPDYRILIVDLDAHQGNGHEEMAINDDRFFIFDVYNKNTWPGDFEVKERINFDYPVDGRLTGDDQYLQLLHTQLPAAIEQCKPNLIIYNAGTDPYYKDPIGCMKLSKQGLIMRDRMVFAQALQRDIPIVMVLSGGYHTDNADIIGCSIEQLLNSMYKK